MLPVRRGVVSVQPSPLLFPGQRSPRLLDERSQHGASSAHQVFSGGPMRIRLVSLAALFAVVFSAAGGAAARPTAPAVDKINYATSFGQFGRDAYVYAAIEKGYFAQEEIEVSVTTGTGSVDVM